jgi:hypothetical protein
MNFQKSLIIPILGAIVFALIMFVSSPEPKLKESKNVTKDFILGGQFTSGQPADEFEEPDNLSLSEGNLLLDAVLEKNSLLSQGVLGQKSAPISVNNTKAYILPDIEDVLEPTTYEGALEIIELLKNFGELISSAEGILTQEFKDLDAQIIAKTKEVYRNPHQTSGGSSFVLGEQCGLSAGSFSYPPGRNDLYTACGGTPPIGGTQGAPFVSGNTCNTDPPCYYSGYCFYECYSYVVGSYCYCWVPSCYGVCQFGGYLWDSVNGICGCAD